MDKTDGPRRDVVAKRVMDLVFALALLPPVALICLLVTPLIWWETRASPIFLQKRVGLRRMPFNIVKLRTMRADTAHVASHLTSAAQITRSGRWLRRLKIDEGPQLANVLLGQMSFVGPRPSLPSQIELIQERDRRGVFALRPGITGPAQVAGVDMSTPALLAELDATYLGRWSMAHDLRLIMRTATGGGNGDAVDRA